VKKMNKLGLRDAYGRNADVTSSVHCVLSLPLLPAAEITGGMSDIETQVNDTCIKWCISRFDSGAYSRLQFLRAVSHSVGAHTDALHPREDTSSSSEDKEEVPVPALIPSSASTSATRDAEAPITNDSSCEVCLLAPRACFALVPCGHSRFCERC